MSDSNKAAFNDHQAAEVTARLYELIQQLTQEERYQLLIDLEKHLKPKKRKYPRKDYFMNVQFSTNDRLFNGFIKNISSGGIYVETLKEHLHHLHKGHNIVITFQHPDTRGHVKITGEIVRINSSGMGVHFAEKLRNLKSPTNE